jgi:adenylate kinase
MIKTQTFIFVGRSGSGKGTQLELLKNYIQNIYPNSSIKSIIMGEIFREFFKKEGYVEDIARDLTMKQGKFQPNFLTDSLFVNKVIDEIDQESFFFFDGYPRNINQLGLIKELLLYVRRENFVIINIDVSRESVKKRMLARGRGDDTESSVESRLDEFDRLVAPMLEEIKNDPSLKYIEVDGEPSPEKIHEDIISKLEIK